MNSISPPANRRPKRRRARAANGAGGVSKRSDGRWQSRITVLDPATGLPVRKYFYGRTEEEARRRMVDALAADHQGALLVARGRELTVREYAQLWLAGLSTRPTTQARYRQALVHVTEHEVIGRLPLKRLSPQHVSGLLKALHAGDPKTKRKPLKSRSCNRVRDVLRNMLNDAMREGRLSRNVAELARPLPLTDISKRTILKPDDFPAFVRMCEEHDMGVLWMLALCTARRESELLGLRWSDIAWEKGEIRVERQLKRLNGRWYLEAIKTGEKGESTIKLPDIAIQMLRRHQTRQAAARLACDSWSEEWPDLIFTITVPAVRRGPGRRPVGSPGHPLQPTTISKGFPEAIVEAHLPRMRFHDLRHSTASFLLHMNVPPLEVARILGHSSVTTTWTIYAHEINETSPLAAQLLDEALRKSSA